MTLLMKMKSHAEAQRRRGFFSAPLRLCVRYTIIQILIFTIYTHALAADLYPLHSVQQQKQFNTLTQELRCLVCQNESIADSNAKLAVDLRNQVYHMVQQGKSNKQIKAYMVARYGDFVLFKPVVQTKTYLLWFGPFLLLLIGFFMLWFITRRARVQKQSQTLTVEEQQKLQDLLQ